ncbi:hypothetical protein [Almyronema epifaneia]|uniref:Uncharacterized protein n=1 Tax=Almyronema epifaneia S1 TaxID=2991925 RepID=A0ABW6IGF0_9CYAN
MNNTDMELRAIREKLQSLQQEPLSLEATALPWDGHSDDPPGSRETPRRSPTLPRSSPDQIRTTVETLRQRSSQPLASPPPDRGVSEPPPAEVELPVAQYQQQLQQQAQQINQLSLAQEEAILQLKSMSDRYNLDLKHHLTRSGQAVPLPLPLCAFDAALVPAVHQNAQGNLTLTYRHLDLQQEERYAYELAENLRQRHGYQSPGLGEPSDGFDLALEAIWAEPIKAMQTLSLWIQQVYRLWRRKLGSPGQRTRQRQLQSAPLTFLDAVIWFSGGAMLRVGINFLLIAHPLLRLPVMLLLLGLSAGAIYRAVLLPRPDYAMGYRLLIAIAGLIVGGRL